MPIYRQVPLTNLALYQQALRTAERIKTLHRKIDDISRELHEQLDDLHIIIKEIQRGLPLTRGDLESLGVEIESFNDISAVDDHIRGIVARYWPHLASKLSPEEE